MADSDDGVSDASTAVIPIKFNQKKERSKSGTNNIETNLKRSKKDGTPTKPFNWESRSTKKNDFEKINDSQMLKKDRKISTQEKRRLLVSS